MGKTMRMNQFITYLVDRYVDEMHKFTSFSNKIVYNWKCFHLSDPFRKTICQKFFNKNMYNKYHIDYGTISHAHDTLKSFTSIHIIHCKPNVGQFYPWICVLYWPEGNNTMQSNRSIDWMRSLTGHPLYQWRQWLRFISTMHWDVWTDKTTFCNKSEIK